MMTQSGFQTRIAVLAITAVLVGCAATPPSTAPSVAAPERTADKVQATPEAIDEAYRILARSQQEVAAEWQGKTFEEFEATVYREPDTGTYIVNGDIPIHDVKHLREFYESQVQQAELPSAALIVMSVGGVDAAWSEQDKRGITYCVSNRFNARHGQVVAEMAAAAAAWEAVADIDFMYVPTQDANCTASNNQVVFDVRPTSSGQYLARAFFPNDTRAQRNVLIDDSSFNLDPGGNLTLVGILRHELGHTLGFRHEHTRPESGTCFEDQDWRELTSYDAFSVMHYPQCNGQGDWSLNLTAMDQSGVACLYGPAPGFTIDTSICQPATSPTPPCGERVITESATITRGQELSFGPYATMAGSPFRVAMSGQGDPDLYVRFQLPPDVNTFDCRPYLTGASETCDLTAPANAIRAFVMVRGYTEGAFTLSVTHTPTP